MKGALCKAQCIDAVQNLENRVRFVTEGARNVEDTNYRPSNRAKLLLAKIVEVSQRIAT